MANDFLSEVQTKTRKPHRKVVLTAQLGLNYNSFNSSYSVLKQISLHGWLDKGILCLMTNAK